MVSSFKVQHEWHCNSCRVCRRVRCTSRLYLHATCALLTRHTPEDPNHQFVASRSASALALECCNGTDQCSRSALGAGCASHKPARHLHSFPKPSTLQSDLNIKSCLNKSKNLRTYNLRTPRTTPSKFCIPNQVHYPYRVLYRNKLL